MVKIYPADKIRQKLKLLSINKKFIDHLENLREKWDIPKNGISSNKDSLKWKTDFLKKSDSLITSPEYISKYKLIKSIKNEETRLIEDAKLDAEVPINEFEHDVNILRSRCNLPPNLNTYFEWFIITNKTDHKTFSNTYNIKTSTNKYGEKELFIQIYADTKLSDINTDFIKLHQKSLPGYSDGRYKKRPNLDRDKKIADLKRQGKTNKKIVYNKNNNGKIKIATSPRQIQSPYIKDILNKNDLEAVAIPTFTTKILSLLLGEVDAVVYFPQKNKSANLWDYAASTLLLEEQKHKISSLDGTPLKFDENNLEHTRGWLASRRPLHKNLLNKLNIEIK